MSPRTRKGLLWLHRWTGIATGLVVGVVCLSGTALAFSSEYREWRMPDRYTGSGGWPDSVAGLMDTAASYAPAGSRVTSLIFSPAGEAPARVFLRDAEGERTRVYLHPDGRLVEWSTGSSRDAMSVMLDLHRQLLAGRVGRTVVGISTILFVLVLLTGIPLWWPRTWQQLVRGLSVRWQGAKTTRRLYDLHVSLGAWSVVLLLAMGVTGVFFAYDGTQEILFTVTDAERPPPPPESGPAAGRTADVDAVVADLRSRSPEPESVFLVFPSEETGALRALVFESDAPHPSAFDTYYFDQYTGASLGVMTHASLSRGERIRRALFPWHTGEWSLATKLLWGLVSFLGASFPLTGFLLWFRRRRRSRARARERGTGRPEGWVPEPSPAPAAAAAVSRRTVRDDGRASRRSPPADGRGSEA